MENDTLAGRQFGEIYRVQGRKDLHAFLLHAVEASGGRVLYASRADRAPIYLGVQLGSDERLGLLVYPSALRAPRSATARPTRCEASYATARRPAGSVSTPSRVTSPASMSP